MQPGGINQTAGDIVEAMFALLPQLARLQGWERDKAKEDARRRVTDILEGQRQYVAYDDKEDDEC